MTFWICHQGPVILNSPPCPAELRESQELPLPTSAHLGVILSTKGSYGGRSLPSLVWSPLVFTQQAFIEDLLCAVPVAWNHH